MGWAPGGEENLTGPESVVSSAAFVCKENPVSQPISNVLFIVLVETFRRGGFSFLPNVNRVMLFPGCQIQSRPRLDDSCVT